MSFDLCKCIPLVYTLWTDLAPFFGYLLFKTNPYGMYFGTLAIRYSRKSIQRCWVQKNHSIFQQYIKCAQILHSKWYCKKKRFYLHGDLLLLLTPLSVPSFVIFISFSNFFLYLLFTVYIFYSGCITGMARKKNEITTNISANILTVKLLLNKIFFAKFFFWK